MWFKNIRLYRLVKDMDFSADALEAALKKQKFSPCLKTDFSRYGWVSPLGKNSDNYTHTIGNYHLLCARKQEKILPPAAVNEIVEEKILEYETLKARPIYRKEKLAFKEETIHRLLPQALTRSYLVYGYFDLKQQCLIIDAASPAKAEEFLEHLRASLGSLPVVPLKCQAEPVKVMTRWLQDKPPSALALDDECALQNSRESKNIVRCKNQELDSTEIMEHLKAGKQVIQLALVWREAIRFVLTDDFAIKRVRFAEIVQDQAQGDSNDQLLQFDQDFAVMTLQFSEFIKELLEAFGGLEKTNEAHFKQQQ